MTPSDWIAIAVAAFAAGGQVVNVILALRIRVAVLQSEKSTGEDCARTYVTKEFCEERHGHRGELAVQPLRVRP